MSVLYFRKNLIVLADVHDPPKTNWSDQATISEALHPQADSETSPSADEIFRLLPEEDRHATTADTSDDTRENEDTSELLTRRVNRFQYSKL